MKKLSPLFYILLAVLSAAVLGLIALWFALKNDVYLYVALGLFPFYLVHVIYNLATAGKRGKRAAEEKSGFLSLVREPAAEIVYLTYLGGEKGLKHPSSAKKAYLAEFYTAAADRELLKRHLWFDLEDEEEARLTVARLGQMKIPYPFLKEIAGKTVYVQAAFGEAAKELPAFETLFGENEIVLYGE